MRFNSQHIPRCLLILIVLAFWWHGPIFQHESYHAFADARVLWGLPNAIDVLSNLGFALVAGVVIANHRTITRQLIAHWHPADAAYLFFAVSILVTTIGSGFYHLAPNDGRLFWDRLPIALACASLIAAVRLDQFHPPSTARMVVELSVGCVLALLSVIWWKYTGDLRLYLGLQVVAIFVIPGWQTLAISPTSCQMQRRRAYAFAIVLYVLAKIAEVLDTQIFHSLVWISGHSIKHLLASLAAALIVRSWYVSVLNRIA
ncbi:hypothetical protein [Undibacterium fentianense]|uniref:Alkaline phytoceramidase n=1 Tax=Undibacterium fentianense TaxID=2828728 RepID=A0A941IGQ4_9BURK|nr:hypothetical protein [Undibacterium fentianense]MBR7801587.1 hypothetical protein [Undibacterium fentianense]